MYVEKKNKKFDRGINPHDGSRRRLKSEEHKSVKDYKRLSKPDVDKIFEENTYPISVESYQMVSGILTHKIKMSDGSYFESSEVSRIFEISFEDLKSIISSAYRQGYSDHDVIEAGLEPYHPDDYAHRVVSCL